LIRACINKFFAFEQFIGYNDFQLILVLLLHYSKGWCRFDKLTTCDGQGSSILKVKKSRITLLYFQAAIYHHHQDILQQTGIFFQ